MSQSKSSVARHRPSRFFSVGLALACGVALGLAGCANNSSKDDGKTGALTPGAVKMNVVPGETTQTQVLEAFGPPDVLTHKDGHDVWTYDKTTYDFETHGSYFTVLIAGTSSQSGRSSSRSTMLILYFDDKDVVSDYRLSSVNY
jgi:hypothetical protein